ncbi:winged helix-turn-helix domain-containing protein [Aliivibrio sifiae]|uniref:Transcriptional regulator n=1 Tax=Aliivibrio sifiae TaxID=566293 RepID=A0A2S7X7G5_9GAMM|nr:winged helix-turn-helix domain-containing protein [Aliivibrio sifiae]PQJ87076.1 hypothetical protein BTO23_13165 [Aliivibrio sifiae]GLR73790.1 transcriptional regulator [Aliivibrio sifiae]
MLKQPFVKKQNNIHYNNISLNIKKKSISTKKITIQLTDIELKIIILLIKNHNVTHSKEDILNYAWNRNDNYVSVVPQTISLLRKKLHRHNIDIIDTIKGEGYKATEKTNSFEIPNIKIWALFVAFLTCTVISYMLYDDYIIKKPIVQELVEHSPNIFKPSNSLPVIFDNNVIKTDIYYYINRQKCNLSISACKLEDGQCRSIYNKLFFTNENNTPEDITPYLSEVYFDYTPPKLLAAHQIDDEFKVESSVDLGALDNDNYSGHAYLYYDLKTERNEKLISEFSIFITESGYEGSYRYSSDLTINLHKENDKYFALLSNMNKTTNFKLGREHHGIIKDQTQLYAYPRLLNGPIKTFYAHIYPISKNTNFTYFEDTKTSLLMFEHK